MDLWLIAKIAIFLALAIAIITILHIHTQKHIRDHNKPYGDK